MPALKLAADRYVEGAAILRQLPGRKSVAKDPADPDGPPLWILHPSQSSTAERQLRAAGVTYHVVDRQAPAEAERVAVFMTLEEIRLVAPDPRL